jgi:proteasome accessory factor A
VLSAGGTRPKYEEVLQNPIDYIWVSHVYSVLPDDRVRFQLSQRADHILKTIASRVRFNRALINPKWEHFYSSEGMTRLHLLFGESNQNEFAYALKIGTTNLVLRCLEEGLIGPRWTLAQPVLALRDVSRDDSYGWNVLLEDGTTIGSIDLQREYLSASEAFRGDSEQTDWVLNEWASILAGLETNPMDLGDRVDWVAKRKVVEQYVAETGVEWCDDSLHSIDLEYHNIDPEKSLYHALQEMGETRRFLQEIDIVDAMTEAPSDTRAKGRSMLVEKVLKRKSPKFYLFNWNGVALDRNAYIDMSDPFDTYDDPKFTWDKSTK